MTASTIELFEAIGEADPDRFRQALDGGADPDSRHPDGYSALVLAAGGGDAEVVRRLLAAGAEVNSPRDPRYRHERAWGPIVSAIVHDHPQAVRELLAAGADVKCYYDLDDRPETLLSEAALETLDELNVSCTCIYVAVGAGNHDVVRAVLEAGADPDEGDGANIPLDLAVCKQDAALVQMLLAAGADVNLDMEDYQRVVMTAAWGGNLTLVKLLHEADAELDTWSQGDSPLSFAARGGHPEVYEYLLPHSTEEQREHATREMLAEGVRDRASG